MSYIWMFDSVLKKNGWHYEEGSEYDCVYSMRFDIGEGCTAYIDLCAKESDIYAKKDFGIYSISVKSHDIPCFKDSHDYSDLQLMEKAIEYAEENLLTLGLPFCDNYVFHTNYPYRKMQRNKKNRRKFDCDKIVEYVAK